MSLQAPPFCTKNALLVGAFPRTPMPLTAGGGAMKKTAHQYHLWMSDEENAELEKLCNLTGLSKANLIRKLIMSKPIRERPNADFVKLTEEINDIGVNFNQLVHKANTVGYVAQKDLKETQLYFERILMKLRSWEKTWR